MVFLLVLVIVPVLFCVVSWILFSASQLFSVEEAGIRERRSLAIRKRSRMEGQSIAVGSQARGDEGTYLLALPALNAYRLQHERSSGIPNLWHDDIWLRRN